MIEINNLKKTYKDRDVLDIDGFAFENGKKYALIGANGSGKSTLIKIIAKVISPDKGSVTIEGKNKIAYMPQKPLGFNLSVTNNMKIAGGNDFMPLLEKLGLIHLKKKNASRLSGGETQRVALARMLAVGGEIMLLDEPTSAMDIESATLAESLLLEETKSKLVIFATHSIQQAERLADIIIFLHEGKILEYLPAGEFRKTCQNEKTKEFIGRY